MGLCEFNGVTGTRDAIGEWVEIFGGDPQKIAPVDRAPAKRQERRRNPRRRKASGEEATQETKRPALTADEKRVEAFERKTIPFGKYAGKRWAEVPVGFVEWFATFKFDKASVRALQIQVKEYLDLKYGLRPGELF